MSALAIDRRRQVDQVIDRLAAALQVKYPYITPEAVYDPPDRVDAWVRLHGAADADEWDEIRLFGDTITDQAWEEEGILVLIHTGTYRNAPPAPPPLDPEAVQAAIEAYKRRRQAADVMDRMVQEIQRVFPQLPVEIAHGGPECEDGWVTIHVPELTAPEGADAIEVAHSVREVVADLVFSPMMNSETPVHIYVTHETDPTLNDPALAAALIRHYQLTEALGELYPLIHRADPDLTIETEVIYYPLTGGDACLVLHGVQDAAQMEQIRGNTQDVVDTMRREFGLQIELRHGNRRDIGS